MTCAFGDSDDMHKAIEMLNEVKESIINAYEIRTKLSRAKLSHLMSSETWMNARKAIELGFADEILSDEKTVAEVPAFAFSGKAVEEALINKITAKAKTVVKNEPKTETKHGRSVSELMERLNLLKR